MSGAAEQQQRGARRRRPALLVLVFLAGLLAPAAERLAQSGADGSTEAELRSAAQLAPWSWEPAAIQAWPRALEAHFADTFGLRTPLLRWNSLLQIGLFELFPSGSMYLGGDGFWFFTGERSVELMRGTAPFARDELDAWCATLAAQDAWCRARGIHYLYVLGPSKERIYPELVPQKWNRLETTRYDQLVARLGGGGAPLLDLRPAMLAERAHDRPELREFTYHPLGTHWTERGCWAAYAAIEQALSRDCPAFVPLAREELATQLVDLPGDTWAARAYVSDVYKQPYYEQRPRQGFRQKVERESRPSGALVWRRGADRARPRVLIFRDSFGFKVDEFLAEDCSLLVQSHQRGFDPALVEDLHPDVVIQLYVDRQLGFPPPVLAAFDEPAVLRARFERAGAPLWKLDTPRELDAQAPFALPQAALEEQRCAVLRLQLECARAGRLELVCPDAGCGEKRLELACAAGQSELFLRLSGRELARAPSLRVAQAGPLRLLALELRPEAP
jgi:hypothetical protein